MKTTLAAFCAWLLLSAIPVRADDPEPHLQAAKQAAGFDFTGTLARICIAPGLAVGIGPRGVIPDRALWRAEPARMFDNLYFVGTRVHSAWALKGSGGLIIIDKAAAAGATVLMTNHSEFDGAYTKSRLVKLRGPGEPHPYDVGRDGVGRYFTLMEECALANKARLTP